MPPEDDPDRFLSTPRPQARSGSGSTSKGWQPPAPEELQRALPQYQITQLLGRGGMGAVYKGIQLNLDRPIAIKILPPGFNDADAGMNYGERFKNEARAMARLNHAGIVKVFDFGETSEGLLYIVMEFIEGTDAQQMLDQDDRVPSAQALAIIAHICDALAYAHERGIIHRDIKPANIMITRQGEVKVADFGLAKMERAGESGLTRSGMTMGTLHYMAPEALMLGSSVDHRADIYAVGVMFYRMLTGRLPQGIFKPPSEVVPGLDPRLDAVVLRCLREDRDQRTQSASELRRELDAVVTSPVAKLPPPSPSPASTHSSVRSGNVALEPKPSFQQTRPPVVVVKKSSHPLLWAAVVVLGGIIGVTTWQRQTPSPSQGTQGGGEMSSPIPTPPQSRPPPPTVSVSPTQPAPTPPASAAASPLSAPATKSELKEKNISGFPDADATVLSDTPQLLLSICNDATYLMVQAVVWGDHEDREGTTGDGRKIGDWTILYFRTATPSQPTPQVDRDYLLNPWPRFPGLNYQIVLSERSTTTIKSDSQGRGSLQHVDKVNGGKARVDTLLIPLSELSKKPGETLWMRFYARSPVDQLNVRFPTSYSSEYKLSYTLIKDSALRLDPQLVADKRPGLSSPVAMAANPTPASIPTPAPPPVTPVNVGPQTWTNAKGRQITASFVRLVGDQVTLKMNGRNFELPLSTLAPASQEQARTLAQTISPAASASTSTSINIGDAPDIKFTAVDGRQVDLAALKGKVVLIDFWATWCGPCVAGLPDLLSTWRKYHDQGFEIIGISLDSDKAALERMTKERGMAWPQYFDDKQWQNDLARRFGIRAVPTLWLIGKNGKIASTNARNGLEAQVAQLLGLAPFAVISHPPAGPVVASSRRTVTTPKLAAIPFPAATDATTLGEYAQALLAYNPWENNQSDKTGVQERLALLQDVAALNSAAVIWAAERHGKIDVTSKDALVTVLRQHAGEQNKAAIFKAFEKNYVLAAVIAEKGWIQDAAQSMAAAVRAYPYQTGYSSHETGFFTICFQSTSNDVWKELEALFSKPGFSAADSVFKRGMEGIPDFVKMRTKPKLNRLITLMIEAARQADPARPSTPYRLLRCSELAAGVGHADALQTLALYLTTGTPRVKEEHTASTQQRITNSVQELTGCPASLTAAETGRWVLDLLATLRWDATRRQFITPP